MVHNERTAQSEWVENSIAWLERHALDRVTPPVLDLAPLRHRTWVRVRGVSNFWREAGSAQCAQRAVDMAVAAHALNGSYLFLIVGTLERVELYIALDDAESLRGLLRSAYPSILLEVAGPESVAARFSAHCAYSGMVSGVPAPPGADSEQSGTRENTVPPPMDRIVRGLRGAKWLYLVRCVPRRSAGVIGDRQDILDRLAQAAPLAKQHEQESGVSSRELVDRRAQYLTDLLEHQLDRLNKALAVGQWDVQVHYAASDPLVLSRLGALLAGTVSGSESRPERIRATAATAVATGSFEHFSTCLSSAELGVLTQLPREEVPGYTVMDYALFDVDLEKEPANGRPTVQFGNVLRDGSSSGTGFTMPIDDLTKHGLIVGVTGAGKTTTVRSILFAVSQAQRPFLVIEPAKTEYRSLLGKVVGGRGNGPIPGLRVFTLGKDDVAPFRLNPFEFQTDDDPGLSMLLSHIDLLKAVFNAAFALYPPMPYVLETALHEVYQDKGWNLATGGNVRLADAASWALRHEYPVFPTLGDLYHKVEQVTRRLGYGAKIEQDVIAGLKARVGSLRIGSKGLMLDGPRGNSMEKLLGAPTVLELENIGNDNEKTFVMGLVLARLYEYRRLQASAGRLSRSAGLKHVLVVEEAHRLLQNTSMEVDAESANPRAQAVETFVNMLSEIRRYGEGVLVAEQIPSKLAVDVIKNSNLKIVHRLLAEDDRTSLAGTMNMSDAQSRHLTTLPVGRAAVFSEGQDHPLLVQMEDLLAAYPSADLSDREVASVAERGIRLDRFMQVPDFKEFGIEPGKFRAPPGGPYQQALQFINDTQSVVWGRIMVGAIYPQGRLKGELESVNRALAGSKANLYPAYSDEYRTTFRMVIVLGIAGRIHERAAEYGWPYTETDALRKALTRGLLAVFDGTQQPDEGLRFFADGYQRLTLRDHGPYPGCIACPSRSRFRADAQQLLTPQMQAEINSLLKERSRNGPAAYVDLAAYLQRQVTERLGVPEAVVPGLSYCTGLVAVSNADLFEQAEVARHLAERVGLGPGQELKSAARDGHAHRVASPSGYDAIMDAVNAALKTNPQDVLIVARANFDRVDEDFFDRLDLVPGQLAPHLSPEPVKSLTRLFSLCRKEYRDYRLQHEVGGALPARVTG